MPTIQSDDPNVIAERIRGANGQVENLFVVETYNGTDRFVIDKDGNMTFPGSLAALAIAGALTVGGSHAVGTVPLIVLGASGQTADLLSVKQSDGTAVFKVSKDGYITKQFDPDAATYIIWKSGSTYYAKNGNTGMIDYSGTVAATVMNAALAALTSGGKVHVKAGAYTLAAPIVLLSDTEFEGEGPATIFTMANAANCRSIYLNNVHRVVLHDFVIEGNGVNQTNFAAGEFDIANSDFVEVYNVQMNHCFASGMVVGETVQGTLLGPKMFHDCSFHDMGNITAQTGAGIYFQGKNNHVLHCHFENTSDNAVGIDGGEFSSVIGCTAKGCGNLVLIDRSPGVQVIHDIVIADNIAWDCVTGLGCGFIDHDNHDISITGNIFHGTTSAQAVRITGVRITFADNIIEESAGTGLLISDGVALSITGNTVHNCTVNGIDVRDVTNSVISNNIIYDNGAGGIYYTNLYLHAVTRTVVEGNTIFNLVGTDSRCGIEEDTECDYNVIRNNHLFGNRVAQVYRTSTALHSMYGTLRSEHFGPMAIATTTFCHAAEAGDGTAKVVVPTAQPDAPRSCTITTTNNAAPTGSVIITGFNNFGEAATETIVIVPGGTGYGGQPFLQITSYTIPATVGAGDTVSLGLYDCLGLANRINLKSDVFKLKRNKADEPINLASLSLELQSYNFQPIADGDEITIWYFADENYQWQ